MKFLKSLQNRLHQKRGMTLIEIAVSLALLAMIMVFVLSVLSVSFQTIAKNAELKQKNAEAAGSIENTFPDSSTAGPNVTEQAGSFQIDFNGITISADGNYISGTDDSFKSKFHYFKPD